MNLGLMDPAFMGSLGGTALWTPAQITTALWLEATDVGTVTTSGGQVTQINDKSGNNRNASQATASARPTYVSNSLNGLPVIRFPTGLQLLSLTNVSTMTNSFVMILMREGLGNISPLVENGDNYSYLHYGNIVYVSSGVTITAPVPMNANTWYINCWTGSNFFSNGTNYGAASGPFTRSSFSFINASFSNNAWNLAALLVLPGSLSLTNRQYLEGYYAHRCGLTAALPSDHPYKTAPPYI
jgi:hypothetical protein